MSYQQISYVKIASFNSLSPVAGGLDFQRVIFKRLGVVTSQSMSHSIAVVWMAWCRQSTTHYLN